MKVFVAWLCWWAPIVPAIAIPPGWKDVLGRASTTDSKTLGPRYDDRTYFTNPETGKVVVAGETDRARTVYAVVSLFCAVMLALMLGHRATTLKNNALRKCNFTSILLLWLFFFGLGFIFSTTVVELGQNLRTHTICYAAAIICLVFYTGSKLTIYMFLLERARIVRAPFMPRHRDSIWIIAMIFILGGFGSIAVVGYLSPIVELSKLDGKCRIGLPVQVSFPLLSFDVGVNFLLTGLFIWLLRPVLSHENLFSRSRFFEHRWIKAVRRRKATGSENNTEHSRALSKNIKILLRKCLIGSTFIMLPTAGNMAQFYIMKGRELGWICLTICTLDVSWGVLIINWLTIGSAEAEKNLTTLMTQRAVSTPDLPLGDTTVPDEETPCVSSPELARIEEPAEVYSPDPGLKDRKSGKDELLESVDVR